MSIIAMTPEQAAADAASKTVTPAPAPAVTTTTEPEAKEPRTLEALKAARRAATTETEPPKEGETAKTAPPKPGKKTTTVDVDVPAEKLETFKKLNSELMAARKELETLRPAAGKVANVEKAMKLIAEGKSFDGIRELVGIDAFNQAVKQVIGAEGVPAAVTETPKEKELREKLEALEKDSTSTKEQLAAAAAMQREAGVSKIIEEVKTLPAQFPYLSRSADWVREALKSADETYVTANAKCREDNGRDMNDGEKNALLRAALEVAEEDHAKRAKLYGAAEPAPAPAATKKPTPRTVDNTMRAAVTKVTPARKGATLEELKRERRTRS
jgi:outer membrane murein-binding lipoprotein Lpp